MTDTFFDSAIGSNTLKVTIRDGGAAHLLIERYGTPRLGIQLSEEDTHALRDLLPERPKPPTNVREAILALPDGARFRLSRDDGSEVHYRKTSDKIEEYRDNTFSKVSFVYTTFYTSEGLFTSWDLGGFVPLVNKPITTTTDNWVPED